MSYFKEKTGYMLIIKVQNKYILPLLDLVLNHVLAEGVLLFDLQVYNLNKDNQAEGSKYF